MRVPRVRLSVRRMMVAVAIVAILFAALVAPRWRTCSEQIAYHALEEEEFTRAADSFQRATVSRRDKATEAMIQGILASGFRVEAARHAGLQWEWRRARLLPWVALPPIMPRRERHGQRR